VVRTGLWTIVHALQSANGNPYQVDGLDSRSVVHRAIRHSQPSFLPGMISEHRIHFLLGFRRRNLTLPDLPPQTDPFSTRNGPLS
jgi:hypothetical protein